MKVLRTEMKLPSMSLPAVLIITVVVLLFATGAHAVTFDWATIGNPGNAGDVQPQGTFGAVEKSYRISTTEVTNAQYADFLNQVDPTGTNSLLLFNSNQTHNFGGIENAGTADGARYEAQAGREQNPVTFVSWFDAVRFVNWMHNGQGNSDTEAGAYTLLGGTAVPSNGESVTRNSNASFWIPSEDEWYKAAYHDANAGIASAYFDYATGSDELPVSDQPFDGSSAANYFNNDNLINGFNDGYAVTGSSFFSGTLNPLSDVGAYSDANSPYGTFDQSGNVLEWNDTFVGGTVFRGVRGGSWDRFSDSLSASSQTHGRMNIEKRNLGFRVATIPEPSALLLGALTFMGLLSQRRSLRQSCGRNN